MTIYIDLDERKLISKKTYERELYKCALRESRDLDDPLERKGYMEYLIEEGIELEPNEYCFMCQKFEIDV